MTIRPMLRMFAAAGALALSVCLAPAALAASHGMSLFGDLKYGEGFTHLDYVNPDAPKGGRMVMLAPNWANNQNPQTFNTLNGYVTKGDAPPRIGLVFDSLMAGAADEPDSMYGLVAESVEISDDGNEVRFRLRPEARFHDGSKLTAQDVAWSLTTLKEKGHPSIRLPLKEMVSAEAPSPDEVVVRFSGRQSPELKLVVAGLPIFSRASYEGRDFEASTLEPPLGSGAYRVGRLAPGRFIEFERVPDYWAKDLAVNVGQNNFDVVRLEFFRDRTAEFEAFKKGDVTFRQEFTSKTWATEYNFPALAEGRVVKEAIPDEKLPDFQAFYINTRREKFADPRTRRAIGLAFDFEWANKNLFFNSYERSDSFFEGSVYEAAGEASPAEVKLLEPHRDRLPPEVFGPPPTPTPSDGSGRDRVRLREASRLLAEAGWKREGSRLVNDKGEPLEVEFLVDDPNWERVLGKYVEALRSIGMDARIRMVDAAQYQARQSDFDFDIVTARHTFGATPLEGLENFFGSVAADTPGSQNYAGIKDPVVDARVAAALGAPDRETHRTALSTLDRVLRAGHYVVPAWKKDEHWVAHWDMFGRPELKPEFGFPFETTWWYDAEKAARIGKAE